MWRIRQMVLFALSVLMTVRAGTGLSTTPHASVVAKNGENVTLPCSHGWNLSKKEDKKTLAHATWYLTNPDTTVASHDCPGDPISCKTKISKNQTFLDMNFDNKTANLIIADVRSTDSGLYFCVVVTTKGLIQQTVSLSVSETDTSIRIKSSGGVQSGDPSKIIVTANTKETLTCSTFLSKDFTGAIFWNSNGLNLTEALQNQISISEDEEYVTSSVTFHPTHADDNKWVECDITESTTSPRRFSLKVQDKTNKSSQGNSGIPINNGTSSQVCFYHQSRDASRNKTCCQADDIVFLPNRLSNGDISILCCTNNVCQAFQLNIVEDDMSDADHGESSRYNFSIATVMSISLYVVIGTGIVVIVAVFIWRKRKALRCRHHEEHIYCEPPALPARLSSLPHPPLSWIECEQEDESFDDGNYAGDDELQELSTTYSDFAPGAHRTLTRTISTLSRRGLRDSEVVYANFPFTTVLSRIKAVGWSYF